MFGRWKKLCIELYQLSFEPRYPADVDCSWLIRSSALEHRLRCAHIPAVGSFPSGTIGALGARSGSDSVPWAWCAGCWPGSAP